MGPHQGLQPLAQPEYLAPRNPSFKGHQQQQQQSVRGQMLANSRHGNCQNANTRKQNTPPPPDPRHLLEDNPNKFMIQEELPATYPS